MRHNHLITPEGTRDILSAECMMWRKAESMVCSVFSNAGYTEVQTPELEFYDVFCIDSEPIRQEQMYKMTDKRGRLLALRPDNTMPIARMVASKLRNSHMPLRLFYDQPCYRISNIRGGSHQMQQAGVELIGASGVRADIEVLDLALNSLSRCLTDFRLELGHSGIFKSLVAKLPIEDTARETLREYTESKNYAALSDELDSIGDIPEVRALKQLPRLFGGREVLQQAAELINDKDIMEQLAYLEHLYTSLDELGFGNKLMIDLGLVNQNDYYSGIVFSAYTHGSGEKILSGGRYDGLFANFGCDICACGFGINIGLLAKAMPQNNAELLHQNNSTLVFAADGDEAYAIKKARDMNAHGKAAEFCVCSSEEEALRYARENNYTSLLKISRNSTEELL